MGSEPNILYLLLWHLNHFDWFEIPGIGRFTAFKKSAYLDHLENQIFPGLIELQFEEVESINSEIMLQNIVTETGYTIELLEEHLSGLCQTFLDSLSKTSFFDFSPFGKFKKDKFALVFQQSENNLHMDFFGKKVLPLSPIIRVADKIEVPIAIIPLKPKKTNTELRSLLIALGLLWVIFICLLGCPKTNQDKNNIAIMKGSDTIILSQPKDTFPHRIISNITSKIDTIEDGFLDTSLKMQNEIVIDTVNMNSLSDSIRNKPCIIIVGSFLKIQNADKLSKQIVQNRYQVYREKYGKFNRVGVQFNCFEKDLKEVLIKLKEIYHPDAWILKY